MRLVRRSYGQRFERLYAAAVGTRFGDSARTSAVSVLGAQLTANPALLSCVSAMSFAPWLLFGLPAGAFVDRVDKRRAFLTADAVRCALAAALVVVASLGELSVAVLIAFVFCLTTLQTVSDSCFNSMLPQVVPDEDLGPANARLSASQSTAGVAGPPTGSLLASLGAAWPFLLNVAAFGASAAWVRSLPKETGGRPAAGGRIAGGQIIRTLWHDILDGMREMRRQRLLSLLLSCVAVNNMCNGLNSSVLPLLAIRSLGVGSASYGLIIAANAASMVAGNIAAGSLLAREVPDRRLAAVAIAVKVPGFLLVCTATSIYGLAAGMAVLGFASGMWNVPSSTLLMRSAPKEVMGRMISLYRTVSVAGMPAGAVFGGALAEAAGLRAGSLAAAVLTVAVLAYFVHRSRRLPVPEPKVMEKV
jgi:MFS family permease